MLAPQSLVSKWLRMSFWGYRNWFQTKAERKTNKTTIYKKVRSHDQWLCHGSWHLTYTVISILSTLLLHDFALIQCYPYNLTLPTIFPFQICHIMSHHCHHHTPTWAWVALVTVTHSLTFEHMFSLLTHFPIHPTHHHISTTRAVPTLQPVDYGRSCCSASNCGVVVAGTTLVEEMRVLQVQGEQRGKNGEWSLNGMTVP